MTQDAYSINTATDNGRKLHEELTGVWDTIRTTHAGIARPDYAQEGLLWYRNTDSRLYLFDGANDREVFPLSSLPTPNDYGARGNGSTDDTDAFLACIAANTSIFIPLGDFMLSDSIVFGNDYFVRGSGAGTKLNFGGEVIDRGDLPSSFSALNPGIIINGRGSILEGFSIGGAGTALKLKGESQECTGNIIRNLYMWGPVVGLELNGSSSANYPCYWNDFYNVLVEHPRDIGVYFTKETNGDSPNANCLTRVRVFSKSQEMQNQKAGFYIEHANLNNVFQDCEADLHSGATECFRLDAGAHRCQIRGFRSELNGGGHGIHLVSGSGENGKHLIEGHDHNTAGASIYDPSQSGNFWGINAYSQKTGEVADRHVFTERTRLSEALVETLYSKTENLTIGEDYILDSRAVFTRLNLSADVNVDLQAPADVPGMVRVIKKVDNSGYVATIRIEDDSSSGPDTANYKLVKENDFIVLISNGAEWSIIACNNIREP
jgi:hypothetical protein